MDNIFQEDKELEKRKRRERKLTPAQSSAKYRQKDGMRKKIAIVRKAKYYCSKFHLPFCENCERDINSKYGWSLAFLTHQHNKTYPDDTMTSDEFEQQFSVRKYNRHMR